MAKTTKTTKDERLKVIDSLTQLQKTHKAILDKYSIDTKARVTELLNALRGKNGVDEAPAELSKVKAKEMLEELREIKLKPEKGRGKDLYRIEKLLGELEDIYQGR